MKCDLCGKNEAHVHLTQAAGDTVKKIDLCEACAMTNGVNDPTGFSFATLMEKVKEHAQPNSD